MARVGLAVQFVGIAIAAATLLLMWKLSPAPGRIPGVSAGPEASLWFLVLAAGLIATGLASVRWTWARVALAVAAVGTVAYGLISHRLVGMGPIPVGLSAGATVALAAAIAIIGLWFRVAPMLAGPSAARQLMLASGGLLLAGVLVLLGFLIWASNQRPVHMAPLIPGG